MNPITRLAGIAVLTIAGIVASVGIIGGSSADASGTTAECYFFNGLQYQCDISNPDGIDSLNLVWHHHVIGDIDLVDEDYRDCPTKVTIGPWGDTVYGDFTLKVTPCDRDTSEGRGGFGLKAPGGSSEPTIQDLVLEKPRAVSRIASFMR